MNKIILASVLTLFVSAAFTASASMLPIQTGFNFSFKFLQIPKFQFNTSNDCNTASFTITDNGQTTSQTSCTSRLSSSATTSSYSYYQQTSSSSNDNGTNSQTTEDNSPSANNLFGNSSSQLDQLISQLESLFNH